MFRLTNVTRNPVLIEYTSDSGAGGTVLIPAGGHKDVEAILPSFSHLIRSGILSSKALPYDIATPDGDIESETI